MKDLKPLLRDDATEFERQLLNAALRERPSAQLQARMRQGIGLTGPTLWAGNAKALLAALASKSGLIWTAAAVVVAGGVAAGVRHQSAVSQSAVSQSAVSQSAVREPAPAAIEASPVAAAARDAAPRATEMAAPATHAPAVGANPSAADLKAPQGSESSPEANSKAGDENAARASSAAASASSPSSESAHGGSDTGQLREEIRLLDRARGALSRGNSVEAGAALAAYQQRFPDGILTREARLLRDEVHAHERASHDNPKLHGARPAAR